MGEASASLVDCCVIDMKAALGKRQYYLLLGAAGLLTLTNILFVTEYLCQDDALATETAQEVLKIFNLI